MSSDTKPEEAVTVNEISSIGTEKQKSEAAWLHVDSMADDH